ncbi:MAG: hypothetical protein AAFQ78_00155 [Bacteroidota bacterium]
MRSTLFMLIVLLCTSWKPAQRSRRPVSARGRSKSTSKPHKTHKLQAACQPSRPVLRHTKSFAGLEAQVGLSSVGKTLTLGFGTYWRRTWYWKLPLTGTQQTQGGVRYQSIALAPTIAWSVFAQRSTCYWNLTAALAACYERHEELSRDYHKANFNMAVALGTEIELFLTNSLVLLLSAAPAYYFLKNPYGRFGYHLALGFKVTY